MCSDRHFANLAFFVRHQYDRGGGAVGYHCRRDLRTAGNEGPTQRRPHHESMMIVASAIGNDEENGFREPPPMHGVYSR